MLPSILTLPKYTFPNEKHKSLVKQKMPSIVQKMLHFLSALLFNN